MPNCGSAPPLLAPVSSPSTLRARPQGARWLVPGTRARGRHRTRTGCACALSNRVGPVAGTKRGHVDNMGRLLLTVNLCVHLGPGKGDPVNLGAQRDVSDAPSASVAVANAALLERALTALSTRPPAWARSSEMPTIGCAPLNPRPRHRPGLPAPLPERGHRGLHRGGRGGGR